MCLIQVLWLNGPIGPFQKFIAIHSHRLIQDAASPLRRATLHRQVGSPESDAADASGKALIQNGSTLRCQSTIELLVVVHRLIFGVVNDAVTMIGWRVESVEL